MKGKTYTLNYFVRFSGLHDLRKVTNPIIAAWIDDQRVRNNSGRSINTRLAHLTAMLRWQRDANLKMPDLRISLITKVAEFPSRKKCFSRGEVERVLAKADVCTWLLIRLSFDCGLRISELRNLRLQNIEHDRITIIGKGGRRRFAFMSEEAKWRLQSWIKRQKIKDYLWPSPVEQGKPIAVCTIRKMMQAAFNRVGFDDFCPHDLRHAYATDLKRLGIPTRKIQAGLGHHSELTTERYLNDLEGYDIREIYQIKYHMQHVENS